MLLYQYIKLFQSINDNNLIVKNKFLNFMIALTLIILIFVEIQSKWIPKIVWTYWQQQISQDNYFLKMFSFNHKNIISNGWEYRFLNKQNCWEWLDQIPKVRKILQTSQYQLKESFIKKSMFIRLALLKKFGGVWIDYTIILTESFQWLFNLNKLNIVYNKQQNNPELFLIYKKDYEVYLQLQDKQQGKNIVLPIYQFYFMASSQNNEIVNQWLNFYLNAKQIEDEQKKKQNSIEQYSQILRIVKSENIWVGTLKREKNYQIHFSLQIILQRKQRYFDRKWIQSGQKQKRITVTKYYNIWTAQAYKIGYKLDAIQWNFPDIFINRKIQHLNSSKNFPQYFFKMNKFSRQRFQSTLLSQFNLIIQNNEKAQKLCPAQTYFDQDTMFYKYVLQFYPIKFISSIQSNQTQIQKDMSVCHDLSYRFLKQIYIDYSLNREPFFFVSEQQQQKYRQILQNNQQKKIKKKAIIPFSIVKNTINNTFPLQNCVMILIIEPQRYINIRSLLIFGKKQIFVFSIPDKIIIYSGQSYIQKKLVRINNYQFFLVKLNQFQNSYSIYIFNTKKTDIIFTYKMDYYFGNNSKQLKLITEKSVQSKFQQELKPKTQQLEKLQLYIFEQQKKQFRKSQNNMILAIVAILCITVIMSGFFIMIQKEQKKQQYINTEENKELVT